MKTNAICNAALAALSIAAASATVSAADLAPFTRVEATYADSGYDGALPDGYEFGTAFTAGLFLAPQHEVSLTTGYTKWEGDSVGPVGVAAISYDSEQIPVLLNYRFHVETNKGFKFYAGPSIGFIYEQATGHVTLNTGVPGLKPVGQYDDSAFKFAFGGTIGASYAINDGWEITAAAQVLRVSGANYDLLGTTVKDTYGDATRVGFSLGVSYSW